MKPFWESVFSEIKEIIHNLVLFNPRVCLLNDLMVGSTQIFHKTLVSDLLVAARLLTATYWKKDQKLELEEWFPKTMFY